jgi:progressive ankylosis protein
MTEPQATRISFRQLLAFFIPLGISASLVTISHVIINSTLARSAQPEIVIASYALPLSILGIIERPAVLLRQTCSALVRDRRSFRAMSIVGWSVLGAIFGLGLTISYSPLGPWIFRHIFGAEESMVEPMLEVYRVLMFVSIFSGIRCLYHGIIIYNLRTKWLTIGMIVRLLSMYLLSLYFIHKGVESGTVGAIIFLTGMAVEAAVSFWEGRSLLRHSIPEVKEDHDVSKPSQIFHFYRPLLYSSLLAVIVGPSINAFLGKTTDIKLAIASFAIAASLAQLVMSFFSYTHQIVMNFYRKDAASVRRFFFILWLIPSLLIAILSYTSAGPWFLEHVMGVNERLQEASLSTLKVFMIMTLIFPLLDFGNGLLMLRGQTKVMVWSQASNVGITLITLLVTSLLFPGWNGRIGAFAQSLGVLAEVAVVMYVIWLAGRTEGRLPHPATAKNAMNAESSGQ